MEKIFPQSINLYTYRRPLLFTHQRQDQTAGSEDLKYCTEVL